MERVGLKRVVDFVLCSWIIQGPRDDASDMVAFLGRTRGQLFDGIFRRCEANLMAEVTALSKTETLTPERTATTTQLRYGM